MNLQSAWGRTMVVFGETLPSLLWLPAARWRAMLLLAALAVQPRHALLAMTAWGMVEGMAVALQLPRGTNLRLNAILLGLVIALHGGTWSRSLMQLVTASGFLLVTHGLLQSWQMPIRSGWLSLPMALVVQSLALLPASSLLSMQMTSTWLSPVSRPPQLAGWQDVLVTLGSLVFSPSAVSGILVLLVVLLTSRDLAGVLVLACILKHEVAGTLGLQAPEAGLDAVLVVMALSGYYLLPGWRSLALGLLAGWMTLMIAGLLHVLWLPWHLQVLTWPLWLVMTSILTMLSLRPVSAQPKVQIQPGGLPEQVYEQERLASSRSVHALTLLPPFHGAWQVYQGFHGEHTHQGVWGHALDFIRMQGGCSYQGHGQRLQDFICFDAEVIAPASGWISSARDDLADNEPGQMDLVNNWGNYLILRLESGVHIVLAHLRQNSLKVVAGQWVATGEVLACCGSSGRSPQPHLHMQGQNEPWLGAPTRPFALTCLLRQEQQSLFRLACVPAQGDLVAEPSHQNALHQALKLSAGRRWQYTWATTQGSVVRSLECSVSLIGQWRLHSPETGASFAWLDTGWVMALHDRQGPADDFIDAWMLALGLTPWASENMAWEDSPAQSLMPQYTWGKVEVFLRHPLGSGLQSHYRRHWNEQEHVWIQQGVHTLARWPFKPVRASSEVYLCEEAGVMALKLNSVRGSSEAHLLQLAQQSDMGIPAWNVHVPLMEAS
ncbi:MAG: peptidoglycan DD-metalloendopeptidase family protein [Pseudomonadales bacterium]|nr:peptidoglycan DD-metalloendopeptidase family protein [Pseudomonadales bacterium]